VRRRYNKDLPITGRLGPRGAPPGSTHVWNLNPFWFKEIANEHIRRGQYVYIVQAEAMYKVGLTTTPWQRLKTLQNAHAAELRMRLLIGCNKFVAVKGVENALHELLRGSHVRGEWFKESGVLMRLIAGPHDVPIHVIEDMVSAGFRAARPYPKHVMPPMLSSMLSETRAAHTKYL
jgi:hypothetical protein